MGTQPVSNTNGVLEPQALQPLAPGTVFMEDNFSTLIQEEGAGLGMIQGHYTYCAPYFYYYDIGPHLRSLVFDPGGWGPLC